MDNVFDEQGNPLNEYDLGKGYLMPSKRTVHHEAIEGVEEVGHWETVCEYPETGGKDLEWVVEKEGVQPRDAWDEDVDIYVYKPYTEEELKEIQKMQHKAEDERQRIDDIEAALIELAALIVGEGA